MGRRIRKHGTLAALVAGGVGLGMLVVWGVGTISRAGPFTGNGTQPGLAFPIETSGSCGACHASYDPVNHLEPWNTWAGSMMANAGRDPLFWAALDVANNDLPGVGEFCLRCHVPQGWLAGRSEPPGGSVDGCLLDGRIDEVDKDLSGIGCHFCHRMQENLTPPAGQQTLYTENGQFWLADSPCPTGGGEPCRFGPYDYPQDGPNFPPHSWEFSSLFEESTLCGNCHNVTSPANNLIIGGADTGIPFPIERTFREWSQSEYSDLGSPEHKTCQNCHMPDPLASPAYACAFPQNDHTGDLPTHVFAGGNAWIPEVLRQEYPGLNRDASFVATRDAALDMLQNQSATIAVTAPAEIDVPGTLDVQVRVTNLTGHKLPTGYPEGRRMWLWVEVRDADNALVWESGGYDPATGVLLEDAQIKVYEVKPGIWNLNGTDACDTSDTGGNPLFHFVRNNCIAKDNRIPPLGFTGGSDIETQPVGHFYPETAPGSGVLVNYDDTDYAVPIPVGTPGPLTVSATLRYQTASKEYVEFLNDQAVTHGFPDDCIERESGFPTQSRGAYMYSLWQTYGRSPPVDMTSGSANVDTISGCGNGVVDPGETCDPPINCPDFCNDGDACTVDTLTGNASTCNAACETSPVQACQDGDGCCPAGCDGTNDDDCAPPDNPDAGCGCRVSSAARPLWPILLLFPLWFLLRRRPH